MVLLVRAVAGSLKVVGGREGDTPAGANAQNAIRLIMSAATRAIPSLAPWRARREEGWKSYLEWSTKEMPSLIVLLGCL